MLVPVSVVPRWVDPGDDGVTAIEYALIAALVAAAIIVAVTLLGERVQNLYNTIQTNVSAASS